VEPQQGDIWWADLADPPGSAAGYRRPVVVVQCDAINRSRLATTVCVPLTSNLTWANAPGNLLLSSRATGLDRDCVAQAILMLSVDKSSLTERAGRIAPKLLERLFGAFDQVLGRV
jgi:mRNA interferase MazF